MTDEPQMITKSLIEILQSDSAWTDALQAGLLGMGGEFSRSTEMNRLQALIHGLV